MGPVIRNRVDERSAVRIEERPVKAIPGRCDRDLTISFDDALPVPGWATKAEVGVVIALLDVRDWLPWLDQARALLDVAELARAQRRRFAHDRDMLVLAYAFHRLLLAAVTGQEATDVPLYRDERGCPRLRDGLVHTSLSHADGFVALAVSSVGPVGIDLELATRAADLPEIAERVCHPGEVAALRGGTLPACGAELLALWVRKEALLKEAGVGLSVEMNSFAAPEGLVQSPATGRWVAVGMVDAGPACLAAAAGPPGVGVASSWLKPG